MATRTRKKPPPVIQSPPVKGTLKVADIRRAVRYVREARLKAHGETAAAGAKKLIP